MEYRYEYPKRWKWQEVLEFENEEVKAFLMDHNLDALRPTEAMK